MHADFKDNNVLVDENAYVNYWLDRLGIDGVGVQICNMYGPFNQYMLKETWSFDTLEMSCDKYQEKSECQ